MNRIKKIIFSVLGFVLISVSMFPISSYASIAPVIFNFSKPAVTDNTGYIAFKGESGSDDDAYLIYFQLAAVSNSSLSYIASEPVLALDFISGNHVYYHIDGDPLTDYIFSYIILDTVGNVVGFDNFDFTGSLTNDYFWLPSSFSVYYVDCQGNIDRHMLASDYSSFDYLFSDDKYEYAYLLAILNVLLEYGSLSPEEAELLQNIVDSNNNSSDILSQIKIEFGSKLQSIIQYNEEFKSVLDLLYNSVDDLESTLYAFYDEVMSYLYLIDSDLLEIWACVDQLEGYTDELEDLIRQLIDEFTYKGDTEFTEPDSSAFNDFLEIESQLFDFESIENVPMNLDINQNALKFCWDLVERLFVSHDKVFLSVAVVLSFGIIALLLGR